jgi:hypothetical protein
MRRFVILAGGIGVLAFVAIAFAGTRGYKGFDTDRKCGTIGRPPHSTDCRIRFKGLTIHERVTAVTDFSFRKIPVVCEGSAGILWAAPLAADITVKTGRKFAHHADISHLTITFPQVTRALPRGRGLPTPRNIVDITGKFSKDWSRARGTFKFHSSGSLSCTTGTDHYTVER